MSEATLTNDLCCVCGQEMHPDEMFLGRFCYDCQPEAGPDWRGCPECELPLPPTAFFFEEVDVSDDDHRGRRYAMVEFASCNDCGMTEVK